MNKKNTGEQKQTNKQKKNPTRNEQQRETKKQKRRIKIDAC